MVKAELHHVSFEISNAAKSRWFYDRFLVPIGFRRFAGDEDYLGYTDGIVTYWLVRGAHPRIRRHPPTGEEEVVAEHIAFRLPSASDVVAREAELTRQEIYPFFPSEEHPEFRKGYFSASWIDPDGIVLELYALGGARRRSARARPASRRSRSKR
ncbi:MAG TPA: hypothetical protein VGV64_05810, partial [Thermoplasmata archaeon]|nr:hypothetical protein [Thermoplasmata archaeon]